MAAHKDGAKFVCRDCFEMKKCKDPVISWVFFFIMLIAVISIRAVNVALEFSPLAAKAFWYTGIIGFIIFFAYKFRYDHALHQELDRTKLSDKLLRKERLADHDYEVLGTILCKLSSRKDKINYFLIFFFSGVALALAVYVDFFRR